MHAVVDHFPCGEVESPKFCFSGRGHDELDDLEEREDWAIVPQDRGIFREENVRAGVAKLASECASRTIELARYVMPSFG